ncbi:uncharacterized protein Tco025E_05060 [Trypanosoma conorhini]|uniref:Uncharacterized protein n=1 Tax=Trypanosoma conorhini TaxID=83891 RepID=A0A3R7NDQ0_9TRYP|nr:uncharacterized protein Tco025E_05060 [Trypanosoma conorhini]RNF17074.1 hypothetical protein Tco025E_05060 [Trypanosoma conorhini]
MAGKKDAATEDGCALHHGSHESGGSPAQPHGWEQRDRPKATEANPIPSVEGEEQDAARLKDPVELEKERMYELHQKWLHERSEGLATGRSQTLSSSRVKRSPDAPTQLSNSATDIASNLRFRSIISSARFSAVRRGSSSVFTTCSQPLTVEERAAMVRMMEREERRQSALQRAADEDDKRGKLLIDHELQKESATLHRIVELERKKINAIREHQEKQLTRMELARRRRETMERERQAKLEEIRRRREARLLHSDPYAGYVARSKSLTPITPTAPQGK